MDTVETIRDIIESTAKALVDKPNDVKVSVNENTQVTVFELDVASIDRGKVIGREGRNANAIRTLINSIATRHGKRVVLEILES